MSVETPVETYLKSLVSEELKKLKVNLKEKEAQQIIQALMPEIDTLISKRVKEHFIELADFINEKFTVKDKEN